MLKGEWGMCIGMRIGIWIGIGFGSGRWHWGLRFKASSTTTTASALLTKVLRVFFGFGIAKEASGKDEESEAGSREKCREQCKRAKGGRGREGRGIEAQHIFVS